MEDLWHNQIIVSKPLQQLCIDHPEAMRFNEITKADNGEICVNFLTQIIDQENLSVEEL